MSSEEIAKAAKNAYDELIAASPSRQKKEANDFALSALGSYQIIMDVGPKLLPGYLQSRPDLQIVDKHLGPLKRSEDFGAELNSAMASLDSSKGAYVEKILNTIGKRRENFLN